MVASLLFAVAVLGVAYLLGVGHGLILAWTQSARIRRWAYRVDHTADRVFSEMHGYPPRGSQ